MLRLFKKSLQTGIVTTSYPEKEDIPSPGFRGLPEWRKDKCQQCRKCVEVCPTQAIAIRSQRPEAGGQKLEAAINEKEPQGESLSESLPESREESFWGLLTESPEKSYWSIAPKKCLFCGYCEEHCPNQAISLGREYELAENASPDISKIYGRSIHIRHLDAGSCNGCDWEMTALTGPVYDIQRLGFDFVASPRHADILMVTGPVTRNLEIAARKTFSAAPAPKLVAAVGTCACSGGICGKSYASSGGVNNILPVDVYIPGCPPRPQALIQGLLQAVGRWEK